MTKKRTREDDASESERYDAERVSAPVRKRKRKSIPWENRAYRVKASSRKPNCPVTRLSGFLLTPTKSISALSKEETGLSRVTALGNMQAVFNTPDKGVLTSGFSLLEGSPQKRSRTIDTHCGPISIFISEKKVHADQVDLPPAPDDLEAILRAHHFPKCNNDIICNIPVSTHILKGISSSRTPTNRQVVRSDTNILATAIGLPKQTWQFWHLIGHGLWGDASQCIQNFVLGTAHENAIMADIAEHLVHTVLNALDALEGPTTLYLSAKAEWAEGYAAARLAKKVTWTLKDDPINPKRWVTFEFNPLSLCQITPTEIDEFKQLLPNLFLSKPKASPTKRSLLFSMPSASQPMPKSNSEFKPFKTKPY